MAHCCFKNILDMQRALTLSAKGTMAAIHYTKLTKMAKHDTKYF